MGPEPPRMALLWVAYKRGLVYARDDLPCPQRRRCLGKACAGRGGGGWRGGCDGGQVSVPVSTPPPPVSKNHLAQEPPPGSAVEFSTSLFFCQGNGFFMVLVDVGQLFRCAGQHFMCVATGPPIRGDPISQSQSHIPLKPLPLLSTPSPKQPAPDKETNKSQLTQLNIRSFHARWKAHYSPVS